MPPHSRQQRRRQPPRSKEQTDRVGAVPPVDVDLDDDTPGSAVVAPSVGPTIQLPSSAPARPARQQRRVLTRPAPEPVDYTKDYVAARHDLRRIVVWSVLLFAVMVALRFSGLV